MKLQGKKVTLIGLGIYPQGSGISAARFCIERGAKLLITDQKTTSFLQGPRKDILGYYEKLKQKGRVSVFKPTFILGRHRIRDFEEADMIIRNPGVRFNSIYLQAARNKGIPIETDISIFLKLSPAKTIGVTGTRGKSTTVSLIYNILHDIYPQTIIGGNIGVSPLRYLNKLKKGDYAVLELSSWMLESLDVFKCSPQIGVFTNLLEDHLDSYDSMEQYGRAKHSVFKYHSERDSVVLNYDNLYTRSLAKKVRSQVYWFSHNLRFVKKIKFNGVYILDKNMYFRKDDNITRIMSVDEISLPGEHNVSNIMAAVCAVKLLGIANRDIRRSVGEFSGIPCRLEHLGKYKHIDFYNDTTATTPESSLAALASFPANKIILIAGGSEKNLDFSKLAEVIADKVKSLVLFKDKASLRLWNEINKNLKKTSKKLEPLYVSTMRGAVKSALKSAVSGDVVLLSPACSSFGLFKNEFDRGGRFVEEFKNLK